MRNRRRNMGGRNPYGFFSRVAYAFRERQIYLRSEGEVQFITLGPGIQVATLFAFSIGLFWVAYATVNVAFKDQVLALKERSHACWLVGGMPGSCSMLPVVSSHQV